MNKIIKPLLVEPLYPSAHSSIFYTKVNTSINLWAVKVSVVICFHLQVDTVMLTLRQCDNI